MITFTDSTLADARVAGCDTVQIKYDGSFAQYSTAQGRATITMSQGFHEEWHGVDPLTVCTLIGSYRPPTQRLYVNDCWCIESPEGNVVDLRKEPYRARYVAAKIQLQLLKAPGTPVIKLVQNHPISHAEMLWRTLPDIPDAKGLVFRKSMDPVGVPLRVARWYAEAPGGLV